MLKEYCKTPVLVLSANILFIVQVHLVLCKHLGWPAVLRGKQCDARLDAQTLELILSYALIGTIDLRKHALFSVTLTMARFHQISKKHNLLDSFSRTLLC